MKIQKYMNIKKFISERDKEMEKVKDFKSKK